MIVDETVLQPAGARPALRAGRDQPREIALPVHCPHWLPWERAVALLQVWREDRVLSIDRDFACTASPTHAFVCNIIQLGDSGAFLV